MLTSSVPVHLSSCSVAAYVPSCGAISTSRPGFVPSPKRSITTTSRTTSSRNRRRVRHSAPSIWMQTRRIKGAALSSASAVGLPTTKTRLPRAMKKLADLAGVHRFRVHDLRHSHASSVNMGEICSCGNRPLTYGHCIPIPNPSSRKRSISIANYTSNQHTADYHRA